MTESLPFCAKGKVVYGSQRGRAILGIPTANFPDDVVDFLPTDIECGVYYGWASVDDGCVHKMVMSVGWNPYYKNVKKTMETHILHDFEEDFYNSTLKLVMLGYVRPMTTFSSIDELISAMQNDIAEAKMQLEKPENLQYKSNEFFQSSANSICNGN